MPEPLSKSARKVQQALEAKGFTMEVKELSESTRTAAEAAKAIGCTVSQIAKSLIFKGNESGKPILVIASGTNRVDTSKLASLTGETISQPDADFVREHTGFAIGGVSPVGHKKALPTYIDEDLLQYNEIWAAAGTPKAVFSLKPSDLPHLTNGKIGDLKKN